MDQLEAGEDRADSDSMLAFNSARNAAICVRNSALVANRSAFVTSDDIASGFGHVARLLPGEPAACSRRASFNVSDGAAIALAETPAAYSAAARMSAGSTLAAQNLYSGILPNGSS
jgi:hypothetical protein